MSFFRLGRCLDSTTGYFCITCTYLPTTSNLCVLLRAPTFFSSIFCHSAPAPPSILPISQSGPVPSVSSLHQAIPVLFVVYYNIPCHHRNPYIRTFPSTSIFLGYLITVVSLSLPLSFPPSITSIPITPRSLTVFIACPLLH